MRSTARIALAALALVVATGCSPGSDASTSGRVSAPPAAITVTPDNKATGVLPTEGVQVAVAGGVLTEVKLTNADGKRVKGKYGTGHTGWESTGELDFGTRYTVAVTARNGDGADTTTRTSFTTVRAKALLHTAIVPLNGETVGVGLPIQVQLSDPVTDRAAVERALTVTSEPEVEGAWHWIADDKLRYRPREYWPTGAEVTVHVRLRGVDAGKGVYGDEDRDVAFTIGRSVRSVIDVATLRMNVYIDGTYARTIPITAGRRGWETRNGIKVALEKHKLKVMDAATVGISPSDPDYYRLDVHWAIRVTWSGEFVHGAEWSTAAQGRARVSHGCVGMNLANAQWFYNQTTRGDIIEVVNSPTTRTMELDNGFGDWNLNWYQWVEGSALLGSDAQD